MIEASKFENTWRPQIGDKIWLRHVSDDTPDPIHAAREKQVSSAQNGDRLAAGATFQISRMDGEMVFVREVRRDPSIDAADQYTRSTLLSEHEIGPVNIYLFEKAIRGRTNDPLSS